jgi:SAM-dependent methyltransferase
VTPGAITTNVTRAANYHATFPRFPPTLLADDRWLHGTWFLGNDYRSRSGYYGSYPPGYLKRVRAIFLDYDASWRVLHLFAGSVPHDNPLPGIRVDVNSAVAPDTIADAHRLPFAAETFDLVVADPPYTAEDAKRYGTPMIRRPAVLAETARVTRPGGHLVWLDTMLPMFSKADWHLWGAIGIVRSTNHRWRGCMCFRRQARAAAEVVS